MPHDSTLFYNFCQNMTPLSQIGNIPVSNGALGNLYPNIKAKNNKVTELQRTQKIIRLKQGLYVVAPELSGKALSLELIANHIYGPSYISMFTALRYYGLIPETVYEIQSMTIKHSRLFSNGIGRFKYTYCPRDYFSIGIMRTMTDDHAMLIASPTKALCDTICYTPNITFRSVKDLRTYLEENLRFEMDAIARLDIDTVKRCALVGKKSESLQQLLKLITQ